jgi:hypothetical protein
MAFAQQTMRLEILWYSNPTLGYFLASISFCIRSLVSSVLHMYEASYICIECNVSVPPHHCREDQSDGNVYEFWDNSQQDDALLLGRATGERLKHITSWLELNGIIHHIQAAMNSKCS